MPPVLESHKKTCLVELKSICQSSIGRRYILERKKSAFIKHLENSHGGRSEEKPFSDYFDIEILKAYKKPFTKYVEEHTNIASHKGEVLN